ncbi:MAG: hypothetical protein WB676_19530, partial [Bryobacteraceae bacterium]
MRTALFRLILPAIVVASTATSLFAQPPQGRGGPGSELIRQGFQLDLEEKGAEARVIFQKAIDGAPT